MKKHLIAVAVAAAVAAPAAMADTTLYGLAHASVDYIDTGAKTGDSSSIGVSSNSSRLGVKGSEKIGGGLNAIYQFETQLNIAGADSAEANVKSGLFSNARNTFVGLSGGFGTAIVGTHDTPMKNVGRTYDLFGDQIGDSRNLTGSKTSDGAGFDIRPNNVVAYITPELAGFQAVVAYVTDHSEAYNNDFDAVSASVGYKHKMFDVAAAYEQHNVDKVLAGTGTSEEKAYRLGAGVNFAGLRVNALFQKAMDAGFVSGKDQTVWGVGAAYTFGKNVVKAQYFNAGEYDNTNETGASLIAVGYDYKLSKQTTLYAAYATTNNDDAAKYMSYAGGHGDQPTSTTGERNSAFSLGVKHSF